MTEEKIKRKFGRKRQLLSKASPRYPASVEREYERAVKSYMTLFASALTAHMPRIRDLLRQGDMRADAESDEQTPDRIIRTGAEAAAFSTALERIFAEILNDFEERQGLFDLRGRIEKLSNLSRKLTIAEWKRVVKRTLGIDIMSDYYSGLKFQQIFDKWVADNVGLIKTIPQETLGRMKDIVKQGYLAGKTTTDIAIQIREAYGVDRNHAIFIARNQVAKLNADVTRAQHEDAGVYEYVWRTMDDSRVRDGHRRLNDKRFKYTEPPVVDERTGRTANPGQDYNCRCMPLPVFDIESVVLPWEKGDIS
jgi:SPP1 gp7 family putative phage head morphogenesis protein